jgi:hypothetical protein
VSTFVEASEASRVSLSHYLRLVTKKPSGHTLHENAENETFSVPTLHRTPYTPTKKKARKNKKNKKNKQKEKKEQSQLKSKKSIPISKPGKTRTIPPQEFTHKTMQQYYPSHLKASGGVVYTNATGTHGQPVLVSSHHATAVPFATTPNGGIQFLSPVAPGGSSSKQQQHTGAPAMMQMASSSPAGASVIMSSTPLQNSSANAVLAHPTAPSAPPAATFKNLKVGGLPSDAVDADLYTIFEPFGKIESAKVMLNVHTCESRGYGFVLFSSQEAGCRAFGEMNGKSVTLRGHTFTLDIKSSEWDGKQASIETNAIYVRNIPASVTEDELRSVFSTFGSIVSITSRIQPQPSSAGLVQAPPTVTVGGATPPVPPSTNGSFLGGGASPGGNSNAADMLLMMGTSADSLAGSLNIAMMQAASALSSAGALGGGDPLTKLSMIEFTSVESARRAIAETHRKHYFPTSGGIPVLSKFADPPHLKESRRQLKKHQQLQQAQLHQQQAQPLTTVISLGGPTSQHSGGVGQPLKYFSVPSQQYGNQTQHAPIGLPAGLPPQHPYGHHSAQIVPPPPAPPAAHAVAAHLTSSNAQQQVLYGAGVSPLPPPPPPPPHIRFPDAVPLPLAPRGGFQRIFYQGVLGITPDGQLYPIKPEMCMYQTTPPPSNPQQTATGAASASTSLFPPQPLSSSVATSMLRGDDIAGSLGAVGESANGVGAVLQQVVAGHSLWGELGAPLTASAGTGHYPSGFQQNQAPAPQQQHQQLLQFLPHAQPNATAPSVGNNGGGFYMLPATHHPQHHNTTSAGGATSIVQDVET